eukprot:gene3807-4389_t
MSFTSIQYFNQLTKKPSVNYNNVLRIEYIFVLIFMFIFILFQAKKRAHIHINSNSGVFTIFQFAYSILSLKLHEFFRSQTAKNVEESIYKIPLLFQELIVVTDPVDIKYVCNKRPEKYTRMEGIIGALSDCGDNINRMDKSINSIVDGFIKKMDLHLLTSPSNQEINISHEFNALTLDMIFKLGFGYDLDSVGSSPVGFASKIIKRMECVMPNITKRCLSPLHYWKFISTKTESKFDKFLDMVKDFKAVIETQDNADMSDFMKSLFDQKKNGTLSDNEVMANMMVFIIAGHETTSKALGYVMLMLSKNPDILKKVHAEVDQVLETLVNGEITNKNLAQFKYLQQVILETFRMKPLVPFILLNTIQDDIIGTTEIYEGAQVVLSLDSVYRNPKYFANPEEYNPDRFVGVSLDNAHEHNLFPFGYGPRMCPGRNMVKVEMVILIAKEWRLCKVE